MDMKRLKDLAGMDVSRPEIETNKMLNESTVIPIDASIDQIAAMFDAARRGLGLVNQLRNPADKKKHLRAVFINLNKIRAALARLIEDEPETNAEPPII
jgi:cytochrome c1